MDADTYMLPPTRLLCCVNLCVCAVQIDLVKGRIESMQETGADVRDLEYVLAELAQRLAQHGLPHVDRPQRAIKELVSRLPASSSR